MNRESVLIDECQDSSALSRVIQQRAGERTRHQASLGLPLIYKSVRGHDHCAMIGILETQSIQDHESLDGFTEADFIGTKKNRNP